MVKISHCMTKNLIFSLSTGQAKVSKGIQSSNCSKLPKAMDNNKGFNLPGCPGAVDEDRWPSEVYCSGFDYNGDASYPWYKDCCKWDGVKCVPKINCSKTRESESTIAMTF